MTETRSYGDGTRVVRAGYPAPVVGAAFLPGPVPASSYHLAGRPADLPADSPADSPAGSPPGRADADPPYGYGRDGNPTWRGYERALGELEGGTAVVVSSGMAAVAAVLLTQTGPGDVVVLPADGYFGTRTFARSYLERRGVTVRLAPTIGPYDEAVDGARLVLLETPSNPGLDVCDVRAVSALAHRAGALVTVDNTTATPLGQRVLDLGADLVVCSDTKAMTGHSDLLLGHLATRDPELAGTLLEWRTLSGAVPGPFETWLAHRSLGTLDLRLARHEANARALAEALRGRPEVTGLRWPGLPGDPAHPVAVRQMRRFNGVLSCVLPSAAVVERLIAESALLTAATSFGGLHTTVDRRAQWGGDAVAPGFVRISVGCEDAADLVADVLDALDRIG
jgi:cystathionine gamma-lyase